MSDIVERLRGPAPLHREAKDAADEITRLRNQLHLAQEWSARVIAGQGQDMTEITRLRAEVEDLGNRLHHVHRLWANNEHALRAENERLRTALEKMQRSRDRYRQAWEAEKVRARAALEGKHD